MRSPAVYDLNSNLVVVVVVVVQRNRKANKQPPVLGVDDWEKRRIDGSKDE